MVGARSFFLKIEIAVGSVRLGHSTGFAPALAPRCFITGVKLGMAIQAMQAGRNRLA